jgi:hypothetical protein
MEMVRRGSKALRAVIWTNPPFPLLSLVHERAGVTRARCDHALLAFYCGKQVFPVIEDAHVYFALKLILIGIMYINFVNNAFYTLRRNEYRASGVRASPRKNRIAKILKSNFMLGSVRLLLR